MPILQRIPSSVHTPSWQHALAQAIRDPKQLLKVLNLPDKYLAGALAAHQDFPLLVPLSYVKRIKKGDINDPLLRQVLPLREELADEAGFSQDPVGDKAAIVQSGLLQKYKNRVLLMMTSACPVHCRYCFRRHFPYSEHKGAHKHFQEALKTIAADQSINEVILSGGDPLSISDNYLGELVQALDEIPHLTRVRIHSRYPIFLPERITPELLAILANTRLKTVMVIHCNHANEIDEQVYASLSALKQTGITLLNQSVLLKQVNDDADSLIQLSETLFNADVLPYYLHLLDKVQGAAHFDIREDKALALIEQIRQSLPGYLVPSLVREVPGLPYKKPIESIKL